MKSGTAQKISNLILSCAAGLASFIFSLSALLYITEFDQKILASLVAGAFCLLISYIASERPNGDSARALTALGERLMAIEEGDLISPAPESVRKTMPKLAAAVDALFAEVRSSIENAHALGMYDPVTSLPNRLHFRSEADKLLSEAGEGTSSAMLFVDLDRFKMVNDSLGHARGDQLLIMVANRLRVVVNSRVQRQCARPAAARAPRRRRIHDLLPGRRIGRRDRAGRAPDRASAISEPFELYSHSVDIGASVGVAVCLRSTARASNLLMRAADIAMYRAKSCGGGQHCLFTAGLASEHQARDRYREGADRSACARRVRARLPAADEPGDRRAVRRRGAASVEPSARRAEASGHLHPGRRADRHHLRDRRMGDWRGRTRRSAAWRGNGFHRPRSRSTSARVRSTAPISSSKLRQTFVDAEVPLSMVELEFTESAAMEVSAAVIDGDRRPPGRRRSYRDRRFRYRLFEHRPAALIAARPCQARPVADRRHRELREGARRRPGGDPADQGRRLRGRRRGRRDRSRRRTSCAQWAATSSRASSSRPPMFENEFLAWTASSRGASKRSVA